MVVLGCSGLIDKLSERVMVWYYGIQEYLARKSM